MKNQETVSQLVQKSICDIYNLQINKLQDRINKLEKDKDDAGIEAELLHKTNPLLIDYILPWMDRP